VDYPDALEFCPRDGARLPPLAGDTQALYDPLIGSTIDGRYVVESVLGEGGMGVVYAAHHAIIDKRVAIKVLRKEAAADESSAHRFLAEAKAASKIGHQNIVDITDFGVLADGHAYFVMEHLQGVTLGKVMGREGPLPPGRATRIAIQVCRGLHTAHSKNIVHRDLKPENVFLLERDGVADFVKIVDFGIARDTTSTKRLTVAGMVMGTPEYMAPEQASGQETDHRVDQYALGCILYEMVTGQVPFHGENPMQTLTKHVFDAVTLPSKLRPELIIPAELEAIIMRTLAKKRDDRYADLDRLMQALLVVEPKLREIAVPASARRGRAVAAQPVDSLISGEVTVPRRRPTMFLAVAGIAVMAVAALALRMMLPSSHVVVAPPVVPVPARPDPAVPAPRPIAPVPSAAPQQVDITLSSVPPGADVFCKDELLGTTPTRLTRPRGDEPLQLVFRKTGYREATREVQANKDAYLDVSLLPELTSPKRPNPGAVPKNTKKDYAKPAVPPRARGVAASAPERPHRNGDLRNPFDDPPQK
jgi:serine/threonine-protein kinase